MRWTWGGRVSLSFPVDDKNGTRSRLRAPMTKSTRRPSFTFGSRIKPSVRENRTSQFRLTARLPPAL